MQAYAAIMAKQFSELGVATNQELPTGTIFKLELPSGRHQTYVILGILALEFNAGSHVCAECTLPGDGTINLVGPMQPLPSKAQPEVIGDLEGHQVAHALDQQFGDFGEALLHWLDGSGPDPRNVPSVLAEAGEIPAANGLQQ